MTEIISFIGRNGAGKSTSAHYLAKELNGVGYRVQVLSFATPLKKIVKKYFNTSKEDGRRDILEQFGQDMKRYCGNDLWANVLADKIDYDNDFVIVDDMRYPVEYDVLAVCYPVHTILVDRKSDLIESDDITQLDSDRFDELLKYLNSVGAVISARVTRNIWDDIDEVICALDLPDRN